MSCPGVHNKFGSKTSGTDQALPMLRRTKVRTLFHYSWIVMSHVKIERKVSIDQALKKEINSGKRIVWKVKKLKPRARMTS